jgi:A32 protein
MSKMKYRSFNIDEAKPLQQGDPHAPSWPFRMLISGSSGSGKTAMLVNLLIGDKLESMYKNENGDRYIKCNDVVLIGKHLNEPKWKIVRDFYELLAKDKKNGEDVTFKAFSPNEIPDPSEFDAERSTIVVFEDLVTEPKKVQNKIEPYFTHGRHSNVSAVYVTQRFYKAPIMVRENLTHIVLHRGSAPLKGIKRIVSEHTEFSQNVTQHIHQKLTEYDFVVFDLMRAYDDPLAIRHRWDLPLLNTKS